MLHCRQYFSRRRYRYVTRYIMQLVPDLAMSEQSLSIHNQFIPYWLWANIKMLKHTIFCKNYLYARRDMKYKNLISNIQPWQKWLDHYEVLCKLISSFNDNCLLKISLICCCYLLFVNIIPNVLWKKHITGPYYAYFQ